MPEKTKNYPPIVRLKKIWILLALVGLLFVAAVILYNLHAANHVQRINGHNQAAHSAIQTLASTTDTRWYHDHVLRQTKPTAATATPLSSTTTPRTEGSLPVVDQDRLKAMSAPISSNQMIAESSATAATHASTGEVHTKDQLTSILRNPSSPYVIQAGTLIPGILMTGIHSDLPGQIIGQVRSNVYDSITGRYVLIPQGSKLIGVYDAKIIYGQERVLVAWQQLILPHGQRMDLSEMAGVDNSGYAGFADRVNAHYSNLLGSAVLMSVLGAGAQLSQAKTNHASFAASPMSQSLSQNLAANVMTTASELSQKSLNIQPTIEIRPGYTFNVSVTKELVFPRAYVESGN